MANAVPANAEFAKPLAVSPDKLKLTPAKFTDASTQIKLPSSIDQFELAGGGRYILGHLKTLQKIVVVDLCEAKILGFIPAADENVLVTGGAAHVVIVLNDKKQVERWSLPDLKREASVPLPGQPLSSPPTQSMPPVSPAGPAPAVFPWPPAPAPPAPPRPAGPSSPGSSVPRPSWPDWLPPVHWVSTSANRTAQQPPSIRRFMPAPPRPARKRFRTRTWL